MNKKADKKFLKETIEAYKKKGIPEEVLAKAIGFKDPVEVLKSDTIVSLGPNIGKIKNTAALNQIARGGPESLKLTIKDHAGNPNYKGKVNTYEAGYKSDVGGYPFYRFNTEQFNKYIAKIRNNNE
jgi:hypothetical protein